MSPDVFALTTVVLAWHDADLMWLWGGLMIVVWGAIIGTLAWMVALPADRDPPTPAEHARKVLAERFVCGEINARQYHDRLELLEREARTRDDDLVDA